MKRYTPKQKQALDIFKELKKPILARGPVVIPDNLKPSVLAKKLKTSIHAIGQKFGFAGSDYVYRVERGDIRSPRLYQSALVAAGLL